MASDVDPFPVGERVPFTVGRKTVGMVKRVIMDGGSTATVEVYGQQDVLLGTVTERQYCSIAVVKTALGEGAKPGKRRTFKTRELAIAWLFVRADRTNNPDDAHYYDR